MNRDSASASEIVTGAMQDHDRGLVVGETTFGKALVQSVYPISGNAGLALTTAHYYTPSGRVIQRPWDASFDDYLTYGLRDQKGERPHPASELHHTDGGRDVYGGGGIEPDHFLPGPIEGFNPSRFLRAIYNRGSFIAFAEHFTKEGDTRAAAAAATAAHKVAAGWQVTDAMVAEFKQDLVSQRDSHGRRRVCGRRAVHQGDDPLRGGRRPVQRRRRSSQPHGRRSAGPGDVWIL